MALSAQVRAQSVTQQVIEFMSGFGCTAASRSNMALTESVRGRDASYLAPPAQIRTGPIKAYGSHLGYVTALRYILATCRMRSSACDTVSRL